MPNYPNPFNPETEIVWQMPVAQNVSLAIYDLQGTFGHDAGR
ncbi:T9SS type A sorting domain-containing protein [candidate division KSB1 bacterium]|nr:T9SS type A sorting domain-containing protein [candidate division KSB1 bacterium]